MSTPTYYKAAAAIFKIASDDAGRSAAALHKRATTALPAWASLDDEWGAGASAVGNPVFEDFAAGIGGPVGSPAGTPALNTDIGEWAGTAPPALSGTGEPTASPGPLMPPEWETPADGVTQGTAPPPAAGPGMPDEWVTPSDPQYDPFNDPSNPTQSAAAPAEAPTQEQLDAFRLGTMTEFNPESWIDANKMERMLRGEPDWSAEAPARSLGQGGQYAWLQNLRKAISS